MKNEFLINTNTKFDYDATHIQVFCNKSSRGELYISLHPAEITDFGTSYHMMGLWDYYYTITKMPRYNQKKVDAVMQTCKTYAEQIRDAYLTENRDERTAKLNTLFAHIIAL